MTPLAAITVMGIWLAGCQPAPKPEAPSVPAPKVVQLAAGTAVPLLLLNSLESGISREGEEVPFLVREDVKDAGGTVLITKGTPAQGRVTWSRREEMLGGLMNRPARLKCQILATVAIDGQAVDLVVDAAKPGEPYEFNRSNTGQKPASQQVQALLEDPKDRALIQAVAETLEGKDAAILQLESSQERLAQLGRELNLPGLTNLAQQQEVGKVRPLLERLRGNGPINEVARYAHTNVPALDAVMELTGVANALGARLDGITHGRNIKAYIGTPVDVFVKTGVSVRVPRAD